LNRGSTNAEVLDRFILNHFKKLRKRFKDVAFYIAYEKNSNTSASANRIYQLIKANVNGYVDWAYHNPEDVGNPGILTTNPMKNLYASNIQAMASSFRVSAEFQEQEEDKSKSCIDLMWKQMGWFSYRSPEKNPNAANQDQKRIWSGKGPPGQNDDLVMVLGITRTFMLMAMNQDIQYRKLMQRRGIRMI